MSAEVLHELTHVGDCVSDKISIIMKENPDMSQDQAIAMAISMCKEKGADDSSSKVNPLTQTKLLKKLQASLNRVESEFNQLQRQASRPEFGGEWGYWMKSRDVDVFVSDSTTVDAAILAQCGCNKTAAITGKISKAKAEYKETTSEKQNCATCRFFNYTNSSCEVVEGEITEDHVSLLWQPHTDE